MTISVISNLGSTSLPIKRTAAATGHSPHSIVQYVAALTGTLSIVTSGMHYGWSAQSLPQLEHVNSTVPISSTESSWMAVMPLFGSIMGSLMAGLIVDIVGRKWLIVAASVPFLASWLMIGGARSALVYHAARFVAGIADGWSFTAVPMYLGEISDPKIRGLVSSACPVSIVTGLLLINVFSSFLSISMTAYVSAVLPLTLLLVFWYMPESPYFYLMKGRTEEARRSLCRLRGCTDVDAELQDLQAAVKEQMSQPSKCIELFTKATNRKASLIALGLRTIQQLSGTTAIMFYCATIFEEARDFLQPNTATIIYFAVQLFLSMVTSAVVDIFGRRLLLLGSTMCTTITLFTMATYLYLKNCSAIDVSHMGYIPIFTLLAFVVVFSLGLQTIPLVVMAEMYPTNVKASAMCLADVYFSLLASAISKFFHATNDSYGMHAPFFVFATCCGCGVVFIAAVMPETKGRTLADIQRYLKGEIKL